MDGSNFSTSTAGTNTAAGGIRADTAVDHAAKQSVPPASSSLLDPKAALSASVPVPVSHPRPSNVRSHSRSISSSSVTGSLPGRKSRHSEPGTSEIHAELITFQAHPNSPGPVKSPRSLLPRSRCHSGTSESFLSEDSVLEEPEPDSEPVDFEDSDTPRLRPIPSRGRASHSLLPESALVAKGFASGQQSRRTSGNSVASSTSARALFKASTASPASDPVPRLRSASCLMASNKSPSLPQSQSEAGLSNVTVTTTSGAQPGQALPGNHNLTTRDPHTQPLDLMRRNQRFDSANTSNTHARSQPDRSRSRAKRRFSGSTANSSHSPSSERGPSHREKEEGQSIPLPDAN